MVIFDTCKQCHSSLILKSVIKPMDLLYETGKTGVRKLVIEVFPQGVFLIFYVLSFAVSLRI